MNTDHSAVAGTLSTPAGPFTVIARDGVVLASGFTDDLDRLTVLIHPAIRPTDIADTDSLGPIADAVVAFFAGDVAAIDAVPVIQRSTALRERGWHELRRIAPGEPISYGELAKRIDLPRGARAAGQVCARNAASLFVPCHRVVASDGSPHHFGWGLPVKEWLLAHEYDHAR
ncbi:MAG TPA: methylated-DNA--[protein]-cysteine S-methyltransferase [Acidimicrobiia bacterium]|jgi:methylated-DNA-[protein]-cysteine S-methyltransferase